MKSKIENILFICTGNTCRSPIAEALFKQKKGVKKSWKCISAGTHAIENLPASLEAQIVVKDKGGNLKNQKSRLVNKNLIFIISCSKFFNIFLALMLFVSLA